MGTKPNCFLDGRDEILKKKKTYRLKIILKCQLIYTKDSILSIVSSLFILMRCRSSDAYITITIPLENV
jgi:hypothetical protein